MRPTNLQFRSPNETTSEYMYPKLNCYGQKLGFVIVKQKNSICTFPKEKRFSWQLCKINNSIGPGSYEGLPENYIRSKSMVKYVFSI